MTSYRIEPLTGTEARYFPLAQLGDLSRLPMTVKILLEQMVRAASAGGANEADIATLARYPERDDLIGERAADRDDSRGARQRPLRHRARARQLRDHVEGVEVIFDQQDALRVRAY